MTLIHTSQGLNESEVFSEGPLFCKNAFLYDWSKDDFIYTVNGSKSPVGDAF